MYYRTRTYIAADWDTDSDAVEQLRRWNNNNYWSLNFSDAHDLTQARDSSLPCSIKNSLRTRLEASKTFVLIVGNNTTTVRAGSCQYCSNYSSYYHNCRSGMSVDYRSYIEFECEKAIKDGIKIVVLYKACSVDRSKCPEAVRYKGNHAAMKKQGYYGIEWDYQSVKKALDN